MARLTIYDSQGVPLDAESSYDSDERIKEFFFQGVRFALDERKGEAVVFFRARPSENARSEQYYAKFKYDTRQELGDLPNAVRRKVEDEEGMELVTSEDDTAVFELLESSRSPSFTGVDYDLKNDLEELLDNRRRLLLGTRSYEDAYAVLSDWLSTSVSRFAIADRANSSVLEQYDVVVTPNSDQALEPLHETKENLEQLRKRRRRLRRQRNSPAGAAASSSKYPVSKQTMLAGGITVLLFALVGGGLFAGTCYLGVSLGPVDGVVSPVCPGGADGPVGIANFSASVNDDGTQLAVSGDFNRTVSDKSLYIDVKPEGGGNGSIQAFNLTGNSSFSKNVSFDGTGNSSYIVTAQVIGENDILLGEAATQVGTTGDQATETPTPSPSPTPTPSPTPSQTQTVTPIETTTTGDSTPTPDSGSTPVNISNVSALEIDNGANLTVEGEFDRIVSNKTLRINVSSPESSTPLTETFELTGSSNFSRQVSLDRFSSGNYTVTAEVLGADGTVLGNATTQVNAGSDQSTATPTETPTGESQSS